jgi:hypothetical protein
MLCWWTVSEALWRGPPPGWAGFFAALFGEFMDATMPTQAELMARMESVVDNIAAGLPNL